MLVTPQLCNERIYVNMLTYLFLWTNQLIINRLLYISRSVIKLKLAFTFGLLGALELEIGLVCLWTKMKG